MGRAVDVTQPLTLGMIFTAFFVMLGPGKLIAPFAHLTAGLEEAAARRLALRATGIACAGGVVAAVLGQRVLATWSISLPALLLAAGIVLFVVALKNMLARYAPPTAPTPGVSPPHPALAPLAVPLILSPYGIATFILILALSHNLDREVLIFGLFLVVMLLNLAVMWYVRAIVRWGGGLLALISAVVGVLQVALAIQLSLDALRLLHILPNA
jgi:multiple antibiotic resistance protein